MKTVHSAKSLVALVASSYALLGLVGYPIGYYPAGVDGAIVVGVAGAVCIGAQLMERPGASRSKAAVHRRIKRYASTGLITAAAMALIWAGARLAPT